MEREEKLRRLQAVLDGINDKTEGNAFVDGLLEIGYEALTYYNDGRISPFEALKLGWGLFSLVARTVKKKA